MLKEEVEVFPVSHKYCFAYLTLVEKNGSWNPLKQTTKKGIF